MAKNSPSSGSDQQIVIRDCETYPFVMVSKGFWIKKRPQWKAQVAYFSLKFHASVETDKCQRVSIATMADRANVSTDSLKRGFKELVKLGFLKIVPQKQKCATGTYVSLPNIYQLLPITKSDDDPQQ